MRSARKISAMCRRQARVTILYPISRPSHDVIRYHAGDQKLIQHATDLHLPFEACGCTPLIFALMSSRPAVVACLQNAGVPIYGRVCEAHSQACSSASDLLAVQPDMLDYFYCVLRENGLAKQKLHEMIHAAAAASGNTEGPRHTA